MAGEVERRRVGAGETERAHQHIGRLNMQTRTDTHCAR